MESIDKYIIDPELVKKQLLQVLSSDRFRSSQVLSVFLQFVVEETLAGRMNEIKEYTIGIKALGRPTDFNPQIDAVVRIHAGRLRRMLHEYYYGEGLKDSILIEVPRGGYIPVFEFRDNGKTTHSVTPTTTNNQPNTTVSKNKTPDNQAQRKATLAVFPFHNLSADNVKDYFVDGMGEQLCIDLARFQHLSVISYYSTHRFAIENKHTREIHELFDVDYILTGSIRFSDGVVQINIQLMLAETDALLWTHTYLRHFNADNLYSVQDEIIEQVLNKIADNDGIITKNIAHTPTSRKRDVFGVYEAVYLYYSFRGNYDSETYRQALSALEHAITIDPDNALIWALLSKLFLNNHIFKIEPSPEDLEKGKAYAEKAMWLDQYCQYANKAIAWTYLLTGKKDDCLEAIERCLDLNSKAPSITGSMGFLMICMGKYPQGFRLLLKTMHLNPVMPWYCNLGFALYYYHSGDYEDAFNWTQRRGVPDIPLMSLVRLAALCKMKEQEEIKINRGEYNKLDRRVIERAKMIISQFIYENELKEKLLKGLLSAGLPVS